MIIKLFFILLFYYNFCGSFTYSLYIEVNIDTLNDIYIQIKPSISMEVKEEGM